jgi:hypothetical protein
MAFTSPAAVGGLEGVGQTITVSVGTPRYKRYIRPAAYRPISFYHDLCGNIALADMEKRRSLKDSFALGPLTHVLEPSRRLQVAQVHILDHKFVSPYDWFRNASRAGGVPGFVQPRGA